MTGVLTIDRDILKRVTEALDACAELPSNATPEQRGEAMAKAEGARTRLQLWMRDCSREVPAQPEGAEA